MAKNEHQGLKIALILFSMVSVILAISTFVFYRQADERAKLEEAAKKAKQDADTRANDSDSRLDLVMHILGAAPLPEANVEQLKQAFAADPKMKTVIDNYEQHMSTYGAGLTKEEMNYASILPKMLAVMRQMNQGNSKLVVDNTAYKKERDDTQTSEKARADVALQKQEAADKRATDEALKFSDNLNKNTAQRESELQMYTSKLKKEQDQVAMAKSEMDKTKKDLVAVKGVNKGLTDQIATFRDEPFEVADGKIMNVNQSANMAWIDLGSADGLRRQTLFSVYDQTDNGVKRTSRKASIEVTRVVDKHLAEARIVFDNPSNPILPGDQIFSPAWRPGKRIKFGLAGFMDIDGDKRSDRNLIRSLLLSSGGEIAAELNDDGTFAGKIDASIRYFVLGDTPTDKNDAKLLAGWTKVIADAEQYGVEIISVDKMLEWVGYRPEVRTVGLGENSATSPVIRNSIERKKTVESELEKFRKRQPPQKTGSAAVEENVPEAAPPN